MRTRGDTQPNPNPIPFEVDFPHHKNILLINSDKGLGYETCMEMFKQNLNCNIIITA